MRSKRDAHSLWDTSMADEPAVDESQLITSALINRQTAARLSGEIGEEIELLDRMKLRFSGQSTSDHRLAVRSASKALLAIQESLSSVGASMVAHIGRAGRWPTEVLAATELKFTPRVLPGSIEFALVHTEKEEAALFNVAEKPLFDRSLSALLKLFSDLGDDSLTQTAVVDQLVSFGPRTSKHLFDLAQVLLNEGLSLDVEWKSPDGKVSVAGIGRRSAAYLKELATASATSTFERVLLGQLITVSEVDRQGLLLDDGSKVLLEADKEFQDELAVRYRQRVQATVEETLTVNLSTGTEVRSYVLTALAPVGADIGLVKAEAAAERGASPTTLE